MCCTSATQLESPAPLAGSALSATRASTGTHDTFGVHGLIYSVFPNCLLHICYKARVWSIKICFRYIKPTKGTSAVYSYTSERDSTQLILMIHSEIAFQEKKWFKFNQMWCNHWVVITDVTQRHITVCQRVWCSELLYKMRPKRRFKEPEALCGETALPVELEEMLD